MCAGSSVIEDTVARVAVPVKLSHFIESTFLKLPPVIERGPCGGGVLTRVQAGAYQRGLALIRVECGPQCITGGWPSEPPAFGSPAEVDRGPIIGTLTAELTPGPLEAPLLRTQRGLTELKQCSELLGAP